MRCTYQITADSRPRVLMRVVQVFDQQSITISSLELTLLEDRVRITLTVDVDRAHADRVRAKLYNQTDIVDVDLFCD